MFFNEEQSGQIIALFVQTVLKIPHLFLRHQITNLTKKRNEGKKYFCIRFMLHIPAVRLPAEYKAAE